MGLLLLGALNTPLVLQKGNAQETSPPTQGTTTQAPTFSPRVGGQFRTEGAGIDTFGAVETFIPLSQTPGNSLTFLEGRLIFFTPSSTLGGNVTIGHRFLQSPNQIFGGYISYDNRNTGEATFNQLGAGFESLSNNLDFRVNGYLPIGDKRTMIGSSFPGTGAFQEGSLRLDRIQQFEEALPGIDAEAGTRLLALGQGSLRGYAGLYYYGGGEEASGFLGVRTRLLALPTENIHVGLTLQNDPRFDTQLIFSVGATFPGVAGRGGTQPVSLANRLGEAVQRVPSITVDEQFIRDTITPTIGGNNLRFVDLGSGSLATIQDALNAAQSNEVIFVGPDTTANAGFNLNVARLNGVQVLGVSSAQDLVFDQGARFRLQPSTPGVQPTIADTVTLGNQNMLSGFTINGTNGPAITGSNINGASISNNTINSQTAQGILLNNVAGTVAINDNNFSNIAQGNAVEVSNNTGQVNLAIANNRIGTTTNAGGDGISLQFEGDSRAQVGISGNTIGSVTNSAIGTTGDGIKLNVFENADVTATISNNEIRNSGSLGIEANVGRTIPIPENPQLRLTLDSNLVTNSADEGFSVLAANNSQVFVNAQNNNITGNNASGFGSGDVNVTTFNLANVCLRMNRNTIGTLVLDDVSFGDRPIQVEGALPGTNTINATDILGTVTVESCQ